ncbi:hypothetical protein [Paraglaciecola sp. 2405UD69-4]|uniref:hypothetical protein n=1 Tax=Paraglaciecola sp. 2405UD69-4 TaxID=3391836 RepID=UPI0039C906B9
MLLLDAFLERNEKLKPFKKKIFISYDFLTTQVFVGKRGLERLDFFVEILTKVGAEVTLDTSLNNAFPIEEFYQLNNKTYSNKLLNYIEPDISCLRSRKLVESYIGKSDLFIGYELSQSTRNYFDHLGLRYIDIWLSPLRFGKDIFFSFYSNNTAIQSKLISYQIENDVLIHEANILSAYCEHFKKSHLTLVNNSALLIGQLFVDKACQDGDRFLTLLDFPLELQKLSASYNKLYLLKHPLMSENDFRKIVDGLNNLGLENVEYLQNENVYQLLSMKQIDVVVALSSSVLKEARFFGKKSIYLFRPTLNQNYIDIYKEFFTSTFWKDILSIDDKKKSWEYLNFDNFLRLKFDAFYAYKLFSQELVSTSSLRHKNIVYNSLVQIGQNLECLSIRNKIVLYGVGSIGRLLFPYLKPQIRGVIDKELSLDYEGVPVLEPADLIDGDVVLISAFKYTHEITLQLKNSKLQLEIVPLY